MAEKPSHDARVAGHVVIDTVITLASFLFFFWVLRSHVPSEDPLFINLFGAFGASCLAGVTWLAWQMFRVVLRGQREDRKPD